MEEIIVEIEEIVKNMLESNFLSSLIIIVISYVVYKILRGIIDKSSKSSKVIGKKLTYIKMFGNMLKYFFFVVTVLIILQIYGFNISSLLAGLGIAGVVVAFAVQDFLKDIIAGFNIITDNVFKIGDVIKYNNIEGKVISVGLKHTKIQDIYTSNTFIISNGNIQEVVNVSDKLDITVPFSYDTRVEDAEYILAGIVEQIKTYENVKGCESLGITEFKESTISYKVRITCNPAKKLPIRRKALRCIKMTLDENNIKIPFNQLDVHVDNY